MKLFAFSLLLTLCSLGVRNVDSATATIKEECRRAKADILFVLDASTTVGPENWPLQLNFLSKIVEPYSIGKDNVRVGVIVFNDRIKYPVKITEPNTKEQLIEKLKKLKYTEGLTFTGEALNEAQDVLKNSHRPDSTKIIILVTDGKSNGYVDPVKVASSLKRDKVMIISVGITDGINKKELREISTSGRMVLVDDFKKLEGDITREVQRESCRVIAVRVCERRKSDLTFILDSSTSIGPHNWRLTLNFVERLVDPLFIGKNSGHVALMTFNTVPRLQFLYKKYLNKVELRNKGIRTVAFTEGLTFMGEALQYFREKMLPKMRLDVSKVVVLISDGKANGDLNAVKEAEKIKAKGVTFIAVGVTNNVNKENLKKISSSHKLYFASHFSDLAGIVRRVQGEECRKIDVKAKGK